MIPDFLIYDEIKRRRQQEEAQPRKQLELPLYRPQLPRHSPSRHAPDELPREPLGDRGIAIIDMGSWLDELGDEESDLS